jgi:hypothetical protein
MPDMSGFIDALIELFGASQDVVPEDIETAFGSSVYRSVFRTLSSLLMAAKLVYMLLF